MKHRFFDRPGSWRPDFRMPRSGLEAVFKKKGKTFSIGAYSTCIAMLCALPSKVATRTGVLICAGDTDTLCTCWVEGADVRRRRHAHAVFGSVFDFCVPRLCARAMPVVATAMPVMSDLLWPICGPTCARQAHTWKARSSDRTAALDLLAHMNANARHSDSRTTSLSAIQQVTLHDLLRRTR